MTPSIELVFGDVREKNISTPNHFVSHMIEHIAWRMGLSLRLSWGDEDWRGLGQALGKEIVKFPVCGETSAAALGMIDDGSASVVVDLDGSDAVITTTAGIERNWFLDLRCEQIDSGQPLVDLLEGLCEGLGAGISVVVWNLEDTHHTWEGVYRGIGIALSRIFTPLEQRTLASEQLSAADAVKGASCQAMEASPEAEVQVLTSSLHKAVVQRGTAETGVKVSVDFQGQVGCKVSLEVDQSIMPAVAASEKLFDRFSTALGAEIEVEFSAKELSSSHVVMEDIGLVLGRCLLEVLKLRMQHFGVNGAGSNIYTPHDVEEKLVQVGVSIEGRKFWRLVPEGGDYIKHRQEFVLGQSVGDGLRTEDLDDFLDGLSGGMSASLMFHLRSDGSVEEKWFDLFSDLGIAIKEAFEVNPYRRGVPPGVKATLS